MTTPKDYCKVHDRVHYGCPCPECDPEWHRKAAARAKARKTKDFLEKWEREMSSGDPAHRYTIDADELRHLVKIARAVQRYEYWRQLWRAAETEENMDHYHTKLSEVEDNEILPALRDANLLREEESGS